MIIDPSKNSIICGDNIEWLKWLPDNSVDLCYIDPPFFSNREYEIIWGNGYEIRSFGDRFEGGIFHYVEWMRPRIQLIHAKLKATGSIFLHCDWHASHRLRCILDDIFGESNFRSEIIWKRQSAKGLAFTRMPNNHDTILYYSKSETFKWNRIFTENDPSYIEKFYRHTEKGTNRRYALDNLANPNPNRPNLTYEFRGHLKVWRWTKEKMLEADKNGLIHQQGTGVPRLKRYLDENKGKPVDTVWDDIQSIQGQAKERLGYPTQKPEALIKRIIECASNKNDLIIDCFAGGGTTAKVALDLDRRFIVGDVSPVAVKIMSHRLNLECPSKKYDVHNLPRTVEEFQQIDGHKFAELVCDLMGWKVNPKKSNDGGIDGQDGEGNPIQVKNHSKTGAGRPEIQKFHSAIIKQKRKKGIFVAWQFASTALEYIAEVKSEHGVEIVAKRCDEIFGDLVIPHEKAENIKRFFAERFPEVWKNRTDRIDEISPAEQMNQAVEQRVLEDKHKNVFKKIKKAKDEVKATRKPKRKSGT